MLPRLVFALLTVFCTEYFLSFRSCGGKWAKFICLRDPKVKEGILILWPVEIVFVVRWDFWLLLLEEMTVQTIYVGAWWLGRPWLVVPLVCQWFSPTSYYNGLLGYHLSSLPFCRNFFCFKLQQKRRNHGKLGTVSIFPLSGICSPMAYVPAPF